MNEASQPPPMLWRGMPRVHDGGGGGGGGDGSGEADPLPPTPEIKKATMCDWARELWSGSLHLPLGCHFRLLQKLPPLWVIDLYPMDL